jgi:hypothetical protein
MSTPEDVKDLFGQLTTTFPTIIGQPTDDDVKRLRKMLTDLLQSIDVSGGADSLSGLIDDVADYQATYGHPFDALLLPMAPYDPSIASDATDAVRAKTEREWSAKADLQRLIRAAERHVRTFLTTMVEDTWLLSLKSPTTFYNKVSLQDLATSTAGLEATDIVSLFVDMQAWWEEDPRVPEYINKLEDAQKKAARATLPITNDWLAATATKSLLAAGSFPIQRPVWDARLPATRPGRHGSSGPANHSSLSSASSELLGPVATPSALPLPPSTIIDQPPPPVSRALPAAPLNPPSKSSSPTAWTRSPWPLPTKKRC